MATMPPDDAAVEVAPNVDITRLSLSQEEGFLLSRAFSRRQPLKDLLASSGMSGEAARKTAQALFDKGALVVIGAPKKAAAAAGDDEYPGVVFDVAAMNEPVDLTEAQRKRILYVHMNLETWNHYALLDLKRTATAADVKKGYFKASKEFHPDAYFRKNLGSYKRRIDAIFRKMKAAYDVLGDTPQRHAYDDTLDPADLTPEERRELERQARERRALELQRRKDVDAGRAVAERDARNAERLKDKRLKRNPVLDRMKRAQDLLELAAAAAQAGKPVEAERHARMAKEFASNDAVLVARAEPFLQAGAVERARALVKRAEQHVLAADHAGAIDLITEAADLAPRDGTVLHLAAKLSAQIGLDRQAMKYAQKATEVAPGDAASWRLLLALCEQAGSWHTAVRAAEKLMELNPKEKGVKDRMKNAKRLAK